MPSQKLDIGDCRVACALAFAFDSGLYLGKLATEESNLGLVLFMHQSYLPKIGRYNGNAAWCVVTEDSVLVYMCVHTL